jgi:hypothetical protein
MKKSAAKVSGLRARSPKTPTTPTSSSSPHKRPNETALRGGPVLAAKRLKRSAPSGGSLPHLSPPSAAAKEEEEDAWHMRTHLTAEFFPIEVVLDSGVV